MHSVHCDAADCRATGYSNDPEIDRDTIHAVFGWQQAGGRYHRCGVHRLSPHDLAEAAAEQTAGFLRRSREQADIARGDGGGTRYYTDEEREQMRKLAAFFEFRRQE